ncbi:GD12866 [Drosophila simulans]|uniref:GD12866 n=1 Tax=Drosophila simulans TaxID=7240 RepID=B4QP57_DROSI|nr:GD12866 [Drosophila simulans]
MPKDSDGGAHCAAGGNGGQMEEQLEKQLESLDQKKQEPTWTALAVGRSAGGQVTGMAWAVQGAQNI